MVVNGLFSPCINSRPYNQFKHARSSKADVDIPADQAKAVRIKFKKT